MRSLIGWISSWFHTILVGESYTLPDGMLCRPVMIDSRRMLIIYSPDRLTETAEAAGSMEAGLLWILRADIFASTDLLFSNRRIRKAIKSGKAI
jgi:hypothetical protein